MKRRKREIHLGDRVFFFLLVGVAISIIFILAAMVQQLYGLSLPALQKFGFSFLWRQEWNPVTDEFGALAFIYGTLVSSFLALLLATPVSVGVALFLTELAPKGIGRIVGFLVEMLAAIPSVVFGLWGIFVLAPWIRIDLAPFLGHWLGFLPFFKGTSFGVGMLAGGIILAMMITPTVSAISREVFRAVPTAQREAALALGATRWEMIRLSVLGPSRSGVFGAVILGLGRALGETMAITMLIGNRPEISLSLFAPAQSMASVIANEYAEATSTAHLSALAAIGLTLFLVSLVINAIARVVVFRVERQLRGRPA